MNIRFSVTLSVQDYIAANLLFQRRYWIWRGLLRSFLLAAGLFFVILSLLTFLDDGLDWLVLLAQFVSALLFGLAMAGVVPILSLLSMRFAVNRHFREMSLDLPATYDIHADGFRSENELGSARLPWNRFHDYLQNERLLLLRRTKRVFFIMPKSQLNAEQVEAILSCLREGGVRQG